VNRRRFAAVVAVMALGAAVLVVRSFEIAVLEHGSLMRKAQKQQQQVIKVPGPRGSIRSADGYLLATSVARVAIKVDTEQLPYPELFVRAAAPLLGEPAGELARRLERGSRSVWLAQRVPPELGEQVRALAPSAVYLVPDFARVYPQGRLAAPVIGFVGREELNTIGRAGLEHDFDAYLAGEPEEYLAVSDAIRRRVRLERLHRGRAGYDLELSLNARLQARSEAAVAAAVAEYDALGASAVVADVHSGRLLALVSLPSFDPAEPAGSPAATWRLRPVQDALEPGSTIKPIIAAAALAAGVIRTGEGFDCRARGTRVAGHWVRDHAKPGFYTIDEVVVYSANTGIIEAAERVPRQQLWQAFDAFGFGRRTGVAFPAEARGLLAEPQSWSGMSRAGLALGQELTVSPLQMAMAYAAIANGGWLPRPRLVAGGDEGSAGAGDEPLTRVLDGALADRLRRMLEGVVDEGTGTLAQVPGFRVAGKTGTAQRAVNGTYDDVHHTAWFAGFLPMPQPRVVIVVVVEDPRERDFWASTVAAPVFAEIAAAAATILDLVPTEPIDEPETAQPERRDGDSRRDTA
jgi:cell division protein FtsI/penicillin-binding protein 2